MYFTYTLSGESQKLSPSTGIAPKTQNRAQLNKNHLKIIKQFLFQSFGLQFRWFDYINTIKQHLKHMFIPSNNGLQYDIQRHSKHVIDRKSHV